MTNVDIWSMTNVKVVNDKCTRDLWDICTSLGAVNDKCRHIVNDKCKVGFIQDHKGTPFEYFLGLFSANEKPLFWALNQSEAFISARFSVLAKSARLVDDKNKHMINDKCRHMINDKCKVVNDKCTLDLFGHLHLLRSSQWQMLSWSMTNVTGLWQMWFRQWQMWFRQWQMW